MWRTVVVWCVVGLGFGLGCGDDGVRADAELDTTIDDGPTGLTNQPAAAFAFHAEPAGDDFLCKVDDGELIQCGSPFMVTVTDGAHTFTVSALGARATVDPTPAERMWTVDSTPPDTAITLAPAVIDNTLTPVFEFGGTDSAGEVTLECALDSASFTACTSPTTLTLVDGAHTFTVRAVDAAGNVDASPATHAWTLDSTAPDTTITAGPAAATTTGPTTAFAFTSPDQTATFECQLDADAFAPCGSPRDVGPLPDGSHTFSVRAKDAANVIDPSPAARAWTVDATPPDVAITATPMNPSNDPTPTFAFASADATATFECQIDGIAGFAACSSPWTGPTVPDGSHTFQVRATDLYGNAASAAHSWVVDTIVPAVVITSGPTGTIATASAAFGFSASGAPTVTECRMDAGGFAACTTPKAYTGLLDGAHTFVVRVTDAAGNAAEASRMFTTDTTAPVVTITSGPPDPTNDSTPTFAFTVTGASAVACQVDTAAFAPCASPFTTAALTSASHTFTVRGTDAVGNASQASQTFVVDTIAPIVTITSAPTNPTNDPTATVAFTLSGATAAQCQIDAAAFADCASPFTTAALADGAHTIQVRATDPAGNTGADLATFVVDTVAPVVTITDPATPSNDPTPTIAFAVAGGATSTQCQVDTGAFAACSSPLTTAPLGDGTHTVTVRATDAAGNQGQDTTSFAVDTQAPIVTLAAVANPTTDTTPTLTFTTSGAPISIECQVDTGAFAACTTPFTTAVLADGSHTVTVRASDAAGNIGSAARTFVVDTQPPVVIITDPASPTNDPTVTIAFAVSGGAITTQCQLDTGAFAPCTTPFTTTALVDGSHTITVRATDAAGNPGQDTATVIVDTTAPVVTISSGPTGLTNSATPTFTFVVSGGPAPTTCRFDTGATTSCTSPITAATLAEGAHTFTVTATDAAGNVGSDSRSFTVDTTPPVVTITGGPTGATSDATPTFAFTVTGGPAPTTCRIDTGTAAACAASFTPATLADGAHTLEVVATDAAGNTGSATRSFTVDTTPPTVTITTFPASPSNDPTPTITFVIGAGPATTTCQIDTTPAVACGTPFTSPTALTSGAHTITVVATDVAGNLGSDAVTITIDTIAPTLTLVGPPSPTNDPSPIASFTVTAGGPATTTCQVDTGTVVACVSPFTLPTLIDGPHTITVRATDAAMNFAVQTAAFTVDTAPPTIAFDDVPPAQWPVNYYDIAFHAIGAASLQCAFGAATFAPCTSPFALAGIPYGAATFAVRATDAAGNVATSATTWTGVPGLVLHYPWEQGDVSNTSLLVQRPAYSIDGSAAQRVIGGWGGTAIEQPAAHSYRRTSRVLSSSPGDEYTAAIWLRTGVNGSNGLVWSNVGAAGGVQVRVEGAQIQVTLFDGATPYTMSRTIPTMQWVNVAVRTTGLAKGLGLWINGNQTDFINPSTANGFGAFQGPDVIVGDTDATLDDLTFYNRALASSEMCTLGARGVVALTGGTCTAGAPAMELDLEGTYDHTGTWGLTVVPSSGASFIATTLGQGIKVSTTQPGFGARGFATFAVTAPIHSMSFWLSTGGAPGTVFDFVRDCGLASLAYCGMRAVYDDTGRLRVDTYISSLIPRSIEIPMDGGYHNIVITEQKEGATTTQLTIYVDGVASVLAVGGGDLFANVADFLALTSTIAVTLDEFEVWGRDLSTDPQMLCENGFDGQWDHVEAKCALTSAN